MGELMVVAFLVTCSPDLLQCRTLDTDNMEWKDSEACARDLPRLKRLYRRAGYPNVMARCRIVLPDDDHRPRGLG